MCLITPQIVTTQEVFMLVKPLIRAEDESLVQLIGLQALVNNDFVYDCLENCSDTVRKQLSLAEGEVTLVLIEEEVERRITDSNYESSLIMANIERLAECMKLNDAETHVLLFTVCAYFSSILVQMLSGAKINTAGELALFIYSSFTNLGGDTYENYGRALSDTSTLIDACVIGHCDQMDFHRKSQTIARALWINPSFLEYILQEDGDVVKLCNGSVSDQSLSVEDFSFLQSDISLACEFLRTKCVKSDKEESASSMANIAILGAAGGGKSALAAALIRYSGFEPVFLNAEKRCRRTDGNGQLKNYKTSQKVLDPSRHVLVVENVDDVFEDINHSAEMMFALTAINSIATIWLWPDRVSESRFRNIAPIKACAAAYGMIINLTPFRKQVNESVLKKIVPIHFRKEDLMTALLDKFTNTELDARHIHQAVKVAESVANDAVSFYEHTQQLLESALVAINGKHKRDNVKAPTNYDIALCKASVPLEVLLKGLRHSGQGRVCLYGPPGTGKSAFARHVAEQLRKPLLVKKASDLMHPYVGMTEKKLAAAFEEARQENGVLLIDEADTLLQSRESASAHWEISFTNELLQQMEVFEGIFIATTNRFTSLDAACMRRFDFKVGLDYLELSAVLDMARQLLGVKDLSVQAESRLAAMKHLTPGDFAVLERQLRLFGLNADENWMIENLKQEIACKSVIYQSPIGFVH